MRGGENHTPHSAAAGCSGWRMSASREMKVAFVGRGMEPLASGGKYSRQTRSSRCSQAEEMAVRMERSTLLLSQWHSLATAGYSSLVTDCMGLAAIRGTASRR